VNPNNPTVDPLIRDAQEAAGAKGVKLEVMKTGAEDEIDGAFASLVELGTGGLVVDPDSFFQADEGKSWRWHRATPSRRFTGTESSSRTAA